jgi:thiamine monophosphate synthase
VARPVAGSVPVRAAWNRRRPLCATAVARLGSKPAVLARGAERVATGSALMRQATPRAASLIAFGCPTVAWAAAVHGS